MKTAVLNGRLFLLLCSDVFSPLLSYSGYNPSMTVRKSGHDRSVLSSPVILRLDRIIQVNDMAFLFDLDVRIKSEHDNKRGKAPLCFRHPRA